APGRARRGRGGRRLRPRKLWVDRFRVPGSGLRLDLDLGTYPDCCMAFGLYELATARLLRRVVREGDVVVDGGANLGYFTLLMATLVGPAEKGGRVHAFEPDPRNRKRLMDHLALNGLEDRVTVHGVALSDRGGWATLHRFVETDSAHNHGMSSLYGAEEGATEGYDVETVRLDEVVGGADVRLMKLDLEGAEPLAVAGAAGLFRGPSCPMLLGEYGFGEASRAGHAPGRWLGVLTEVSEGVDWRFEVVGRSMREVELKGGVLVGVTRQVNVLARPPRPLAPPRSPH
ncbi:MAG: FkbM family methyltransferase, partial [Phycisphaeraceae bacterium]